MDTETAANPADDGMVTLPNPLDVAAQESSQAPSEEAKAPAGDTEPSIDDLAKEALGESTEATPEAEIEVEYEGETFKLPPKLRDALLRQQDYTRKTMDLGEQRKTLETERETFKATASQIAQNFQAHVQLATLQTQIQELEHADISYWSPEQIDAGNARLNALRNQAAGLDQNLKAFQQTQTQAEQQQAEKARQACMSEVAAKVPNFTDTRRQELEALAVEVGADANEVSRLTDPWAYELLHFADIGKKFIERQRRAATMKAAHAGTPATMLGGATTGAGGPPQDMDAYIAWRAAGNG